MAFSATSIQNFVQCPFKYKLQYIDKISAPDIDMNESNIFGKLVHKIVQLKAWKKLDTSDDYFNLTNELLKSKSYEKKYLKLLPDPENDFVLKDKFLLENYSIRIPPIVNSERVEFHLRYNGDSETKVLRDADGNSVTEWSQAVLTGAKDYRYKPDPRSVVVIDWKTGQYKNLGSNPIQSLIYALDEFLADENVDTVTVIYEYLEVGQSDSKTFTRKDFFASKVNIINEKINRIEKCNDFFKVEGPLCNYCNFRKLGVCKKEKNRTSGIKN